MSEIFRDRTEGALARRQDLLRKRRDEFVMVPHAIRRVVVARAARTAAATAMIVTGAAMVAVALSPAIARLVASGMPGINPAAISTFVAAAWIFALVAWATSRARSEHRYAVEMVRHVLPGSDLDHDIERLSHEHPDQVARRMAHRQEIRSAALPVAAAAFVLPATLVYVAHMLYAGGWPSTAAYEQNLAEIGEKLALCAGAGIVAAIVMTRRWARSPSVAPIAAIVALVAGGLAAFMLHGRQLPETWLFTIVSVLAGTIAFINWRLARERVAIEAEDPAAGSELFTLQGALAATRSAIANVRRRVSAPMALGAVAFGTLLVCAGAPIATGTSGRRVSVHATPRGLAPVVTVAQLGASRYAVEPTNDGRLRVTATFVDRQPVEIPELAGMTAVPPSWKAHVVVRLELDNLPGAVAVTPFPNAKDVVALHFGGDSTEHRFMTEACEADEPLGLVLTPSEDWPATGEYIATFLVEPVLSMSACR